MDYLRNEYIFVGTVNKKSRDFFRKTKNTVTNVSSCFESVSKLEWSGILQVPDIRKDPYVYNSLSTEVLEYAERNQIVHSINGALACAIRRKDFKMIDYLEDRFEMHGPACMIAAVESGCLDMVKRYCRGNILDYRAEHFFPDGSHIYNLRERDRIEVCHNWKGYVGDYMIESAKERGYFEILKWLHSQGIPDPSECQGVVGDSVLTCSHEMISWMLKHGYIMSMQDTTVEEGIRQGDYMRWLREMG